VGVVAQLGERVVRNDEVRGSIPLDSTMFKKVQPSHGRRDATVRAGGTASTAPFPPTGSQETVQRVAPKFFGGRPSEPFYGSAEDASELHGSAG